MEFIYPEIMQDISNKETDPTYTSKSKGLEEYFKAVARITTVSPHITISSLRTTTEKGGAHLQNKLYEGIKRKIVANTKTEIEKDPIAHAVQLSSSGPHASAWLAAKPTGVNKMTSEEYSNAMRNRFYMKHPYIKSGTICLCKRTEEVDEEGIHIQKCNICNSQKILSHDIGTSIIASLAKAAGCVVEIVQTNLFDDSNEKGDVLVIQAGKPMELLDNRYTNAVNIRREKGDISTKPVKGDMAARSEREKHVKYEAKCKKKGIKFRPIVFETNGQCGQEANQWINQMIKLQSRGCDVPYSSLVSYWYQRFSVALQKNVSRAQMITANKVHAARYLERSEDSYGMEIQEQVEWGYQMDGRDEGVGVGD